MVIYKTCFTPPSRRAPGARDQCGFLARVSSGTRAGRRDACYTSDGACGVSAANSTHDEMLVLTANLESSCWSGGSVHIRFKHEWGPALSRHLPHSSLLSARPDEVMCPRKLVLAIIYRHIYQHHSYSRVAAAVLGVQGDESGPRLLKKGRAIT